MNEFIRRLRVGDFRVSTCIRCRKKTWPPSKRCQHCLSSTRLQRITLTGRLVEFTTSRIKSCPSVFGIIQMDGIAVLGSICDENPYHGMPVRMTDCGVTCSGSVYYNFERIDILPKNKAAVKPKA
ncbi:MAG TPA: hypothetical protein VE593_02105 [Nitrososphaeraceae archaeon]|nr:hypothetical protein [Nitrososphaeraceae archaeon]